VTSPSGPRRSDPRRRGSGWTRSAHRSAAGRCPATRSHTSSRGSRCC
jgi:hypothetical protein